MRPADVRRVDDPSAIDRAAFDRDGFVILPERLSDAEVAALRDELARVLALRQDAMARNGIVQRTAGTAHHVLERGSLFVDWLSKLSGSPLMNVLSESLGGKPILNSFGAVDNRRGSDQYVANVHRDVRTYTRDQRLMVQLLVTLDPFTAATGATWILPGSHREDRRPDDRDFFARAVQVTAEAGRILFFDSRAWHAAGVNATDQPRRALTLTFTRPFLKPQFDYCRYLGEPYVAALPAGMQQLLGYFARVPATLDEWYQPPERRFYRPGQE